LDANCCLLYERVQFRYCDFLLTPGKIAASYTLNAAYSRDVVSPCEQPAPDRANLRSSPDGIPQHLDVVVIHQLKWTLGGAGKPEDRSVPVAVLPSPPARLVIGGVERGCVCGAPPDRWLEAQATKLFVLCKIISWTRELHAAGIATDHLEGPLEVAKVAKREGSLRRKRECRWVREAMAEPVQRSWVEAACKTCGEERCPGMLVCLVELVDTRHE
jgi:hypothetical protein